MGVKEAPAVYRLAGDAPPAEKGVPVGYKRTEVGVIPEDWDALPLSETARGIYRGASPRPIDDPIWFDETSSIGWVRISDVTRANRYLQDTTQYLSQRGVQSSRYLARGALIMSICATVGRPIKTSLDVCIHDGFVVFDRPSVDQDFLYFVLADLEPRWSSKGQTGSQMNLNTGLIKGTEVAMPGRMAEQRAIAEALSDADTLIESLQQLIAKKRALKQGAMQGLLTGRQRLPGYVQPWVECRLADVGTFRKGQGVARAEAKSGDLPCVRYGELYTVHENVIRHFESTISTEVAASATQIRKGDVLFAGSGETKEEIGKSAALVHDVIAYAGGDIVVFRPYEGDASFFGYMLNAAYVNEQKSARGQGDAVVHINAAALSTVSIRLPSVEEQTAIATVLSDMDAEIDALEARLVKTRHLKAGMMQALLTGRIRLPLDHAA